MRSHILPKNLFPILLKNMPNTKAAIPDETLSLAQFQRWMVAVVTNFGNDAEAWDSKAATAELSHPRALENVLPSKTLNQYERIGIYRRMYFLRMRDALEIDFPSVLNLLGKTLFEKIVEDYFTTFPSQSYTLNDTGIKFPAFVRASELPNKEFIAQLSELELAMSRVMEAIETPPISVEEIASIPPDAWNDALFTPVAAFGAYQFSFPVYEYFCAVEGESPEMPEIEERPNYLYIHRSDFHTRHYALSAEEFQLLELLTSGTQLGQAFEVIERNLQSAETSIEELLPRITARFQEWIMKGVFASIRV